MTACETARQTTYIDPEGRTYEAFWLGSDFVFENQIRNVASQTREHPGWVIADDGLCSWQGTPPKRFWEKNSGQSTHMEQTPLSNSLPVTEANAAIGDDGSGSFLLALCLIVSAGYAFYQMRFGKSDEEIQADNYHPMADVPALPTVYTDDDLNLVYGRVSNPRYQGITEPNPWTHDVPPPASSQEPPPPPPPHSTYVPPVDTTAFSTGGEAAVDPRQVFEMRWLPAPPKGYFMDEESILSNSSQARQIVRDAVGAGISLNFLMNHVFKVSKNSKKHELLKRLVGSIEEEWG